MFGLEELVYKLLWGISIFCYYINTTKLKRALHSPRELRNYEINQKKKNSTVAFCDDLMV